MFNSPIEILLSTMVVGHTWTKQNGQKFSCYVLKWTCGTAFTCKFPANNLNPQGNAHASKYKQHDNTTKNLI
jgi:hypothetical protein